MFLLIRFIQSKKSPQAAFNLRGDQLWQFADQGNNIVDHILCTVIIIYSRAYNRY